MESKVAYVVQSAAQREFGMLLHSLVDKGKKKSLETGAPHKAIDAALSVVKEVHENKLTVQHMDQIAALLAKDTNAVTTDDHNLIQYVDHGSATKMEQLLLSYLKIVNERTTFWQRLVFLFKGR
jgi:hypothetical protein